MKKTFLFAVMAMAFFACTNSGNNSNTTAFTSTVETTTSDEIIDEKETSGLELPATADEMNKSADGEMILYVDFTDEDIAYNKENNNDPEAPDVHNTLFLLDKNADTIKTIMTFSEDLPDQCFSCDIQFAMFSLDDTRVFIVNNPNTGTYFNVLCYDLETDKLIYLSDGESVREDEDGYYYVEGAKGYDLEEGGAFWFTRIVTHDGQPVGGCDTIY